MIGKTAGASGPAARAAAGAIAALATVLVTASAAIAAPAAPASPTRLVAWGFNGSGQLGDGTMTDAVTPVTVRLPAGTKVASFRAGCESSVVLTAGGRVLDWGSNDAGQLGDGTDVDSTAPVRVRLPAGTKVTAIRAGCDYNLAMTAAGRVFAWGQNPAESNPVIAARAPLPAAVRFPAGTRITSISAGGLVGLALTARGQVYAWGDNTFGQLGNGTTRDSHVPVRVRLPAGVKVTAVAAGSEFAVARTSTGGVLAWGLNTDGQLGIGHTSRSSKVPVRVRLPRGTKVNGLFAGCDHAVALTAARKVLAWGLNGDGQVGDGTTTDRNHPVQVRLPAGARVTAISAGCDHSLALAAPGRVLAWGAGARGQLGDGLGQNSSRPVRVAFPAGARPTSVSAGPAADSTLAIVEQLN